MLLMVAVDGAGETARVAVAAVMQDPVLVVLPCRLRKLGRRFCLAIDERGNVPVTSEVGFRRQQGSHLLSSTRPTYHCPESFGYPFAARHSVPR